MKVGAILSISVFALLASCTDTSGPDSCSPTDSLTVLGGDRDEHGCIGSAGQLWSAVREKCIQVFAEGERLNPVATDKSAIISAFVVSNADSSLLELYLADLDKAPILKKKDAFTFVNGQYSYNVQRKELSIADTVQYRGE